MSKWLARWLVLDVVFIAVLVIAIFFLQDPVVRILLGIAGGCGTLVSTIQIARSAGGRLPQ